MKLLTKKETELLALDIAKKMQGLSILQAHVVLKSAGETINHTHAVDPANAAFKQWENEVQDADDDF